MEEGDGVPCPYVMPNKKAKSSSTRLRIRRAKASDVVRLAELAGELGYPTTTAEMKVRLRRVKPAALNAIFVAEDGGEVVGWIHVSVSYLLEVPLRAEINGLVVSATTRSRGTGARLLEAVEAWARTKKCEGMSVRSNVIRDRAHAFYERNGYEHYKTQKSFRKPL
ncbi:MAG TPA: GNAT family N-acetyltransferase [Candidatus Eremiobacteraceae bacterium]|nr:GNAT family N-acetyltransferase [Candidatus Eremiobacteraceae bacterium]